MPQMSYDENAPKKGSVAGRAVIPIPGGAKLLSNVEETGRLLIESAETTKEFGDAISREDLLEMIEGHGRIGKAMISSVQRVRDRM